ncbi:MAG: Lon protease [Candidatus Parcubacteria bacterium]|jgi:ATP-dependent Lon protease
MKEIKLSAAPLIALKNKVLFPYEVVSLVFEREQSLLALNNAMDENINPVFVFQKSDDHNIDPNNLYNIGTIGKIVRVWRMPEGPTGVLVEGLEPVKIDTVTNTDSGFLAEYRPLEQRDYESDIEIEALVRNITNIFRDIVNMGVSIPLSVMNEIINDTIDPVTLSYLITSILSIKNTEKQALLENTDLLDRLKSINIYITKEREILEVGQKVQKETQKQVGKFAKEAMLREQMKAIERELGVSSEQGEYTELKKKLKAAKMPSKVNKKAMHELSRLEKMPPFSPESSYIQNYLEVLASIPWSKKAKVKRNLVQAEAILDQDHYGLDEAKERITEYLAVEQLTKKPQGTILCFYGPPGTGKTSIGESIARATGRDFVKVSLGGVRDETEIRGHRRTYVGAMPGRIIQGLRNIKTTNPVFMLDEIDKLGSDFRGDPSSALLEVLDPAQNNAFVDHYLDVEYDLSDIIFITTANDLGAIPEPLFDRMEIIEFSGYTDIEKLNIAKQYLVPRVLKKSGITDKQLKFTDSAIMTIITKYTFEAGLRSFERELYKIARKVAKEYLLKGDKKFNITIKPEFVEKYLKAEKYEESRINKKDEVGVSTGLGWHPYGGDILFIETNIFKGEPSLQVTGNATKVMQESVQAAFSYLKSNAKKYNIDEKVLKNNTVHVHLPSGAVQKDGPSAGLAIATSILSALTKKKVKRTVAMTGEINIRGKALKISGVKNKVLGAHRAGIKTIIVPNANKSDLEELPSNVKNDITFVLAESFDDVYKVAF